jgi:integrase
MARPKKVVKKANKDGYFRVDRVVGTSIDGKPIKKAFRSKISLDDARAKADKYFASLGDSNIMFAEWANKWLWEYKEPTVKKTTFEYTYRSIVENHLIPYFKHFKLKDISNFMIQQFFNTRQHMSQSQLHKMRLCLMQIYNVAIANRLVDYSPVSAITIKSTQKPKDKQTFTYEEMERIKKEAQTHRFGLFVLILAYMGLRVSELCGLKWEDINFNSGTMSIVRSCTDYKGMALVGAVKNAKSKRTIPIPQELIETLKLCRSRGYIVVSPNGKNITPRTFTAKRYNIFFEETGIRLLSPHQMRHTVGTMLYEKCHDIFAVQSFLGHTNAVVTSNIYVHANADDLREQLFKK